MKLVPLQVLAKPVYEASDILIVKSKVVCPLLFSSGQWLGRDFSSTQIRQIHKNYNISNKLIEYKNSINFFQGVVQSVHKSKKIIPEIQPEIDPGLFDFLNPKSDKDNPNESLEESKLEILKDVYFEDNQYRFVIIPISTSGCGKTTLAKALETLYGWPLISNDGIPSGPYKTYKFAKEIMTKLKTNHVVFADRNNYMVRDRKILMEYILNMVDPRQLTNIRFIGLHFDHTQDHIVRDVIKSRLAEKHLNSNTKNDTGLKELDTIIDRSLMRFQPLNLSQYNEYGPDQAFHQVVVLSVLNKDATRDNLQTILKELKGIAPRNAYLTDDKVENAYRMALNSTKEEFMRNTDKQHIVKLSIFARPKPIETVKEPSNHSEIIDSMEPIKSFGPANPIKAIESIDDKTRKASAELVKHIDTSKKDGTLAPERIRKYVQSRKYLIGNEHFYLAVPLKLEELWKNLRNTIHHFNDKEKIKHLRSRFDPTFSPDTMISVVIRNFKELPLGMEMWKQMKIWQQTEILNIDKEISYGTKLSDLSFTIIPKELIWDPEVLVMTVHIEPTTSIRYKFLKREFRMSQLYSIIGVSKHFDGKNIDKKVEQLILHSHNDYSKKRKINVISLSNENKFKIEDLKIKYSNAI